MDNNVSRPATFDDLKKVIQALNDQNADYLLIGGYALFAHGFFRTTTDIDIVVPRAKDVGQRIINALLVLPDKAAQGIDLAWFEEGDTIRLADEIVIDIMFNAAGETYNSLKAYMETIDIDGIPVKTINLEGLLLTKQTLREKDVLDKKLLQKVLASIKKQPAV
jgi:predicted nucleotidyltransferase